MPPLKRKQSLARVAMTESNELLADHFQKVQLSFNQKWVKLVACVPSTCTLEDVRHLANTIVNGTDFKAKIPACYVSKDTELNPVQIATFVTLAILLVLGISGSGYEAWKIYSGGKISGLGEKILASFSLTTNFKRLMSASAGSDELKCLHGIRAISIIWIILGHTYVYIDYQTLKDPVNVQKWFATLIFEVIHNGWLSVDTFFLLSGMLVTFGGLKGLAKTKGKLNIPLLILKRYLRLTPPVLLTIGIIFCLPLLADGPFWYEHLGRPLETCKKYWWTNLLHFFNWWSINKGCIQTTWYTKVGIGSILGCVLISCVAVAVQTWYWELAAAVHISTGDNSQIYESIDKVHIQTLTHLGPYCIGMILGYYILKYKEKKLSVPVVILGWCFSIIVTMSAILGNHGFSAGAETSEALTIFYAAVHRCAYTCGVAWVLLACVKGYGGPVNSLLSSTILATISRLTFMIYLIHPLVIWIKFASLREREYASHYEFFYAFIAHAVVSIFVAIPMYLLLEAPLSNIERLLFGGIKKEDGDKPQGEPTERREVTLTNINLPPRYEMPSRKSFTSSS